MMKQLSHHKKTAAFVLLLWGVLSTALTAQPAKVNATAGARSLEVEFNNAGVKLAGTLLLPKTEAGKRAPAILLLPSASATQRDGLKIGEAEHLFYRALAEQLAARGYAVLRYDKRCAGASGCKPKSAFDDLVDDARQALLYLRKRAELDPARSVLFGHGEGGLIGSIIGSNDPRLAGLILAAAPGRTLNKLMREQWQRRWQAAGKPRNEIAALLAQFDNLARNIIAGQFDGLTEGLDPQNPAEAELFAIARQADYLTPLFVNDPLQIVLNVKAPVLILQGANDQQLSVKDAQYLNESLSRTGHKDHALHLLPGADHVFQTNNGTMHTEFLALLTAWLQQKLK